MTHDQDEALSISDQVAVIRSGTIAQLGSPQDIYADPVDSELAGFVGDANLVDGTFDGKFVVTALGRFEVSGNLWGAAPGPVTVLVRPEQVQVRPDGEEAGVRARVVSTAFYGHDSIVRLAPAQGVPSAVIARVLGDLRLRPGAEVQVTARGPVKIWPVPEGPVPERPGPGANGPH